MFWKHLQKKEQKKRNQNKKKETHPPSKYGIQTTNIVHVFVTLTI